MRRPFAAAPRRSAHQCACCIALRSPGGHWAEIRERKITTFRAIEYIVFVDGSLLESALFHNGPEAEYPKAIEARIKQFVDGGWSEVRVDVAPKL
jgi:hypothetical protein